MNETTFRNIVDNHKDYLFRTAYFRIGRRDVAEDIVQEAFIRLWDHRRSLSMRRSDLKFYLYRIVYNLCVDHSRSRQPEVDIDQAQDCGAEDDELRREYRRITALLSALPDEQRQVVEMNVMDGMSYADISRITGIPESTLKSRCRVALARLRALSEA